MSISDARYLLDKIEKPTVDLAVDEIAALLQIAEPDLLAVLWHRADQVRKATVGDAIHLRGLIEFSNYCRRHCLYCGLRRPNQKVVRYRLTPEQILRTVDILAQHGFKTVVLQSGEDPDTTLEMLTRVIRGIKSRHDIAITLSIGRRSKADWHALKAAGADRFLLRHETACPELYARMHPDDTLADRVGDLVTLSRSGFELGTGNLVGLPGQTALDLAKDLELARRLDVDMYGVGPFIPHPETPMADVPSGTTLMVYKMMAMARLVLRDVHIPVTSALTALDPFAREKGWQRGANVVMPNATPTEVRARYEIYQQKGLNIEPLSATLAHLNHEIAAIDRFVSTDHGRALRRRYAS